MRKIYKKQITITSTKENPVPVDILATHIVEVSKAMKILKNGQLRERAILVLLADMCPSVTKTQILEILNALPELANKFTK